MKKPNIFNFATSELSQDAFLCWLLSWSEPTKRSFDPTLNSVALDLIRLIFQKHGKTFPSKIHRVEIRKQYKNVDILVSINNSLLIPIEDKIHSRDHSDQLKRYLLALQDEGHSSDRLLPVYIQTGEQSSYKNVEKAGYIPLLRTELIGLLRRGKDRGIQNEIFCDYLGYLESIENKIQSYQILRIEEWNWYSWLGFYAKLQELLNEGEWDYVPNPSGGFLGFWWYWYGDDECEQYLQLEENKLCFKIWVGNPEKRRELKLHWHSRILEASKDRSVKLIKPSQLRSGQWMTVAIFADDYRQANTDGTLNLRKTLSTIKEAQAILDKAAS